jgi:putative endonuclease
MLSNPSPKGFYGEGQASSYLEKNGYKIIERNWHTKYAEIDIVALDGDCLVIVEVKSRFGSNFDTPEEAMTTWKIHSLTRAAELYKLKHPDLPDYMRIDFVGITFKNGDIVDINLIKNITG